MVSFFSDIIFDNIKDYEREKENNMISLIIGNLCSLIGMLTDSVSSTRKRARDVLLLQSLSQLVYGIGALALKGYSAVVQSVVSILRNFFAMGKKSTAVVEWGLVALGVILGLWFNNRGIFGLLPVIANFEYSVAVFRLKDNEWALKIAFAISVVLYAVFNVILLNIVGAISNAVIFIVTLICILKEAKNRKR